MDILKTENKGFINGKEFNNIKHILLGEYTEMIFSNDDEIVGIITQYISKKE